MDISQALVLSITQGISEFLPISSSGHLNLIQSFFGLEPSLTLDIFLNTATLFSVIFFFRKKLNNFIKNLKFIIIGSIPAAIIGVLFKDQIENIFLNVRFLPLFFLVTSIFVLSTRFIKKGSKELTVLNSLLIGTFQSIAILPGVSRSGSTIFAGLLFGLSPIQAFEFSFSLFLPASLGAIALSYSDLLSLNIFDPVYILAFIVTFFVGLFALSILQNLLKTNKFWIFSIYTILLSIIVFLIL